MMQAAINRKLKYLGVLALASVMSGSACTVANVAVTALTKPEVKSAKKAARKAVSPPANSSSPIALDVDKNADYINVMGKQTPELPEFPDVTKKPGYLRGYVEDASGNPLQGAYIGVRSTAVGGFYSGAHAETDTEGFYEIQIPWGVADLYAAGYSVEWGDGLAAKSLHPADGKTGSFASAEGAVKNFVLLPYGITSRENLSENPHLPSTYYGGSIYINYWTREASDEYAPPTNLVEGSTIDITLTPEGKMLDGSTGRNILIHKIAGPRGGFYINNIPLGQYKISAKLADGQPLKMRLNKPKGTVFGMTPTETTESASVLFHPNDAKANMAIAAHGNWNAVEISVEQTGK